MSGASHQRSTARGLLIACIFASLSPLRAEPNYIEAAKTSVLSNKVKLSGSFNYTVIARTDSTGRLRDTTTTNGSFLQLNSEISKQIRLLITAKFNRYWREEGHEVDRDNFHDLDTLLNEAYIEIHDVGGQPVAFIIGKQSAAWGQAVENMPVYQNTPNDQIAMRSRVMGVTVKLDTQILKLFKSLEVSSFSSDVDHTFLTGKLGRFDGLSMRARGEVRKNLTYEVSAIHLGNEHLGPGKSENRASVGLIYETSDGKWVSWCEAVLLDRNGTYKNSDVEITGGVMHRIGPGAILAEMSWIEDALAQIGIGYKIEIFKGFTIGAEARRTFYRREFNPAQAQDTLISIRAAYAF